MSGTLAPSTPTNRRLAGVTKFTVNGSAFAVTEFSWNPGSRTREAMLSLSGWDGYKESPRGAWIAGKFRDAQSVNVTAFTALTNATVVVSLANGKSIVGHNLVYMGDPDVSGADATFDFRFEGDPGTIQEIGVQ